ncbi:SDR family oxidoreductase [Reinekea sp. G2M2-21]|uniref:SDR family oxidoreductase n=1 Tax=Reinekea sp. G2M2-21 TaxID=2788942 RepID=UPI0018AA5362|nr:SDR family oxidoreductase [Reinekea sp. G2M2-21]
MNDVVLITGAGRGIGAATAVRFAQCGYDVVVNYRTDKGSAEQTARDIERLGRRALVVQADVSRQGDVIGMFAQIRQFGDLRILVNNAGILDRQSALVNMTVERMQRILATNVMGTLLCCQQAILLMGTAHGGKGGAIINVSSGAARTGSPNEYVDYAASKGAVDSLTIGLATELANEGIRVNAVRPGLIYTDMHKDGGEPGRVDRLKHNLPLKRGGTAEEVAAAICFLASKDSAYTTGAFLDVTGGR